jgi:hypothetical protein
VKFAPLVEAFLLYIVFLITDVTSRKKNLKADHLMAVFAQHLGLVWGGELGVGILKFAISVRLIQNMLYTKLEMDWIGSYQKIKCSVVNTSNHYFGPALKPKALPLRSHNLKCW